MGRGRDIRGAEDAVPCRQSANLTTQRTAGGLPHFDLELSRAEVENVMITGSEGVKTLECLTRHGGCV